MQTQAGGEDDVVFVAGLAALFERLDGLVRRRPRGGVRSPTIVFEGPQADRIVRRHRSRLRVRGSATVPHALVACPGPTGPDDDPAFFDAVVDQLSQSLPGGVRGMRGMRGLRLPRYWTIRTILDAHAPGAVEADRRKALRAALYAGRARLGLPAGWLRPVAAWLRNVTVGPVTGAGVAEPLVAASVFLFGWRMKASRRFGWFKDEVTNVTGERRDLLGCGLALTADGPTRANATLVQRVLTLALLHDLQAATRFSLLSPFRRRRVTSFVVHLVEVADQSAGHRFLDTLAAVTGEDVRRGTIVALASREASAGGDPPLAPPGTPTYGPAGAADALDPPADRGLPGPRAIVVDAPAGPPSGPDAQWFQLHPVVQPMPVRWAVAVPVAAACVFLALVGGTTIPPIVGGDDPSRCPEEVADEMIGIGDGTPRCSFFPEAADTPTEVDDLMAVVEGEIAAENAEVTASGQPYSTIVFFAPLTVPAEQGRLGENALNQLRGTALAQRRANELANGDPQRVQTRVLLANPGDRFANGVEVADEVVARAEDDETIIGVVGIGQSRRASREALRLLGRHLLPVVAGPVTGDAMIDASPHYYQVSPRNRRVAGALVAFSTNAEIVAADDGRPAVPDGAVIVLDHSDEYSRNLAYDFQADFVDAGRTADSIITYPVEDPNAPVPDPPDDDAPAPTRVGSLDELAQQVCSSLDGSEVVFYASRSQQFVGLLQSMRDDNDCPDAFTVVGGSALTKIVEDPSRPLPQYTGVSLYYAAFASRDTDFNRSGDEFMRLYERAYGGDVVAPDISDGAVAYDAFNALQSTANYAVQNGLPISADTSAQALGGEEIEFDGASGYVALGNGPIDSDNPRVPPDKPVLVLPAGDARTDRILACGRFSQDSRADTWGPDGACPTVD